MTIHVTLIVGQSNNGAFPLSQLPVNMQPSSAYGQTYIFNGDGPFWGVLTPGTNTGIPSNPTAWGLETAIAFNFAREMEPGDIHLIIKSVKGETGLGEALGLDWHPNSVGEMFDLTASRIAAAKAAMAAIGIDATPTRVVWTQGETDALTNRTYGQYLNDMGALFDAADVEWCNSAAQWTINGVRSDLGGTSADIASAQRFIADPMDAYICTHSLATLDGIHYTPQSILALGAADVSAWLNG